MLRKVLALHGVSELEKNQQLEINGGFGSNCQTYPPEQCIACGGGPRHGGCCIGPPETHFCLNES